MAASMARQDRHQVAPPRPARWSSRPCRSSTLVATKAPSAMNTPWPKLSTSIRPKTSVRPEAMMKMIMPIASPATVSVSQVEDAADQRQPASSSANSARSAASRLGQHGGGCGRSGRRMRSVHWCAPSDRPSRRCCSASSAASSAIVPACTTRPSSITATGRPAPWPSGSSARPAGSSCSGLQLAKASIRLLMMAGARPLLGSSISSSSRGSTMARATASICFCPPDSLPAG
jgi:hypothetical protein